MREARAHLEGALGLLRAMDDPHSLAIATTVLTLGRCLSESGELERAQAMLREGRGIVASHHELSAAAANAFRIPSR
jgi:hypothetical protein